jgi:hypothetical protein
MVSLKLDVDRETFERLVEAAVRERRPVVMQAEVILRQALGLPFPYAVEVRQDSDASRVVSRPEETAEHGD